MRVEIAFIGIIERTLPARCKTVIMGPWESEVSVGLITIREGEPQLTGLLHEDEVLKMQKRDGSLSCLKHQLSKPTVAKQWPRKIVKYKRYRHSLILRNDLIWYDNVGTRVCLVSFSLMVEMGLLIHYKMGHPGREKLLEELRRQIWHPSLSKVMRDITRTCDACQKLKIAATTIPPYIKIQTTSPYELVAVDLVAFSMTRKGNVGCLVAVDHNSKFLCAIPIKSEKAEVVADAFKHRVLPTLLAAPDSVLSDNGPEFASRVSNKALEEFGIKHIYTMPNKPSSNGLVERTNQTITRLLRNLSAPPSSWDEYVAKAVVIYNATYHSEIRMSPRDYLLTKAHSHNCTPPVATQQWMGDTHTKVVSFRKGQKVLRKVVMKGRLLQDKLGARFEGPFFIKKVNENKVTYIISDCETEKETRAHHSQLRPYHEPPAYLANHLYFKQLMDEQQQQAEVAVEGQEQGDAFSTGVFAGVGPESEEETSSEDGGHVLEDDALYSLGHNSSGRGNHQSSFDFSGFSNLGPLISSSRDDVFGCMGRTEYNMLQNWLSESMSRSFSGFVSLPQISPHLPSGITLVDDSLWGVSDVGEDTQDSVGGSDWDGTFGEVLPVVAKLFEGLGTAPMQDNSLLNQTITTDESGSPPAWSSFSGFGKDLQVEEEEARECRASSEGRRVSRRKDIAERCSRVSDMIQRLRDDREERRVAARSECINTRRRGAGVCWRSPIRTRSHTLAEQKQQPSDPQD